MKKILRFVSGVCVYLVFLETFVSAQVVNRFTHEVLEALAYELRYESTRGMAKSWNDILIAALRTANTRAGVVETNTLAATKTLLSTPDKALRMTEALGYGDRLSTVFPEWKDHLSSFIKRQALREGGRVTQLFNGNFEALLATPNSVQHLKDYYYDEVRKLFQRLDAVWNELPLAQRGMYQQDVRILRGALAGLHQYEQIPAGAREVICEQVHAVLPRIRTSMQRLQHVLMGDAQFTAQQELVKIFSRLISTTEGYLAFTIKRAVADTMERAFLLAQIRFGNLEQKKQAFHLVLINYRTLDNPLGQDVLREIFSSSHAEFRTYVMGLFRTHHIFPNEILEGVDYFLARMERALPGERAFHESSEAIVCLFSHWDESQLVLLLERGQLSDLERIGVVRALGRFETQEATTQLTNYLSSVPAESPAVFKAGVEEVVGKFGNSYAQDRTIVTALESIVKNNPNGVFQRAAIWALGEVSLRQSTAPSVAKDVLVKIFQESPAALLRAEALLALARSKQRVFTDEAIHVFLQDANAEVRVSASVYLLGSSFEAQAMHTLLQVMELPRGAVNSGFRVLALRHLRSAIKDVSTLREALLPLTHESEPLELRLEALFFLAQSKDGGAARQLFLLFDQVVPSIQRMIIQRMLLHYDDVATLRELLEKIVALYSSPNMGYRFFDAFSEEAALLQRFGLLRGDQRTQELLLRYAATESEALQEFIRAVQSVIR